MSYLTCIRKHTKQFISNSLALPLPRFQTLFSSIYTTGLPTKSLRLMRRLFEIYTVCATNILLNLLFLWEIIKHAFLWLNLWLNFITKFVAEVLFKPLFCHISSVLGRPYSLILHVRIFMSEYSCQNIHVRIFMSEYSCQNIYLYL